MGKFEIGYRVVANSHCNDFNNELPYTILTYDIDHKKGVMRTRGWNDWHEIKEHFINRKDAERELVRLCGNAKAIDTLYKLLFTLYESHYRQNEQTGEHYITLEENEAVINDFIERLEAKK